MIKVLKNKMLLAALAVGGTLSACGDGDINIGFRGVIPANSAVALRVPGSDISSAQSAEQPLLGEASEFYVHTYRVSRGINGHVIALLDMLRHITQQRPTKVEGNKAFWGPYTPGGLEPLTYLLTAEKLAEHQYALDLMGRPRASESDADFKTILDGQVEGSGQDDGRGKGSLVLHFDNAGAMNPAVLERGEIQITFDAMQFPRSVAVDFIQFADGNRREPHDATYRYAEAQDRSGSFLFSVLANIHKDSENRPGLETMALRSRWVASGAGRGDVTISGTEVAAQLSEAGLTETEVRATECWGTDFNVVFQDTVPEELRQSIRPLQGDEAACAVSTADFPQNNL